MSYIIISFIILISYILLVCMKWGVPNSISQTFFSIENKWIFSVVIIMSFLLLLAPLMNVLSEDYQWMGFLMVSGGVLIGLAPNLLDEVEEMVHMVGATVMGVASQIIVILLEPWLMLIWIMWLVLMWNEKRVFWAEVIGGITLYLSLLI